MHVCQQFVLFWGANLRVRIHIFQNLHIQGAASENVLEQLEMPEMVFAGSRVAQKRVKLGRGKWQKNSLKMLAHVTKMGMA